MEATQQRFFLFQAEYSWTDGAPYNYRFWAEGAPTWSGKTAMVKVHNASRYLEDKHSLQWSDADDVDQELLKTAEIIINKEDQSEDGNCVAINMIDIKERKT
jgi:hypothetical protein